MILVINDTDATYAVEWTTDAGVPIVPTDISFEATKVGASAPLIDWTWNTDTGYEGAAGGDISYADDLIQVVITYNYEVPEGRYFYNLRAKTGGRWTLLDTGLLRSRWL